jgi:hypothetical protein
MQDYTIDVELEKECLLLFYWETVRESLEMVVRMEEYTGLPLYIVDLEKFAHIGARHDVRAVPSILHIKNGKVEKWKVGLCLVSDIQHWLANF